MHPLSLVTKRGSIYIYIYDDDDDDDDVCFVTFVSHVLFLFSLYTHVSSFIQLVHVSHLMP